VNRRDSDYFGALGSVDDLSNVGHNKNNQNNMNNDKDAWPLHHSPSQSSNGHGREDSNEKIGAFGSNGNLGGYGAIAPSLPPSSSAGSLRRAPTSATMMSQSTSFGGGAGGAALNRADSMASAQGLNQAMSDAGHGYANFYPGLPPPPPSAQGYQGYGVAPGQGYGQGHGQGLDYSNSMRRPGQGGGYEY
jgi:hypothetical protein